MTWIILANQSQHDLSSPGEPSPHHLPDLQLRVAEAIRVPQVGTDSEWLGEVENRANDQSDVRLLSN